MKINLIKKILLIIILILIFTYLYCDSNIEFFGNSKKIKISVLILLKNNEFYTKKLDFLFRQLERDSRYEFNYFIYENNSKDSTKEEIVKFLNNRKGRVILENMDKPKNFGSIISKERGEFMSTLRNNFKYLHGELDSDYSLLLDSDVIFCKSSFDKLMSQINNINVMVTPFSFDGNFFIRTKGNLHYYDTLELITKDNISYKETSNTCLYPKCKNCRLHRRRNKSKIPKKFLLNNDIEEVNAAFAGFCLIKTEVYNKINWEGTICEHHSFCEKVRNYGKILLMNKTMVSTVSDLNDEKTFRFIYKNVNKFN